MGQAEFVRPVRLALALAVVLVLVPVAAGDTVDRSTMFGPGSEHIISSSINSSISAFPADLDNDDDMDVLVASSGDDTVVWFENLGNGSFPTTPHVVTTTAVVVRMVIAADIDGDGDMDVVTASEGDNKVAWYENPGSGDFNATPGAEHVISNTADGVLAIFATDIDNDGKLDIVAAIYGDDRVLWYRNEGAAFGTARVIATSSDVNKPISVFAADVDGDGRVDVLSTSRFDRKVAWYRNLDGLGTFSEQRVISTTADNPLSVVAADIDGDGDLDVVSASLVDDKIEWYENTGNGTFTGTARAISTVSTYALVVAVADLDGDLDLDVLSASRDDRTIMWHENLGGGVFNSTEGAEHVVADDSHYVWTIIAADMDNDGDLDLVTTSQTNNRLAWYENTIVESRLAASFSNSSAALALSLLNSGGRASTVLTGTMTSEPPCCVALVLDPPPWLVLEPPNATLALLGAGVAVNVSLAGSAELDLWPPSAGRTVARVGLSLAGPDAGTVGVVTDPLALAVEVVAPITISDPPPPIFGAFLSDASQLSIGLPLPAGLELTVRLEADGAEFFPSVVSFSGAEQITAAFRVRFTGVALPAGEPLRNVTVAVAETGGSAAPWFRTRGNATLAVYRDVAALPAGTAEPPELVSTAATQLIEFEAELPDSLPSELLLGVAFGRGEIPVLPALPTLSASGTASNGSAPSAWYECGSASVGARLRAGSAERRPYTSVYTVSCTVPAGTVGRGFRLALVHNSSAVLAGPQAGDGVTQLAAPVPEIVPVTMRSSFSAAGREALVGTRESGEKQFVFFDVLHAGLDAAAVLVESMQPSGAASLVWDVLRLTPRGDDRATLECATPSGDLNAVQLFRVTVGGQTSATGSDRFLAVAAALSPVVTGFGGCVDAGCPTVGGVPVTITGHNFAGDGTQNPVVVVSGSPCELVTANGTHVVCTLPSGSGRDQLVTVSTTISLLSVLSQPVPLASYAVPVVESLASPQCTQVADAVLSSCTRNAELTLSLAGRHFGADASVLVGGSRLCAGLDASSTAEGGFADDRQTMTCVLPAGSSLGAQPVVVVQRNGGLLSSLDSGFSGGTALLAFEECPSGTKAVEIAAEGNTSVPGRPARLECVTCARNTFQPLVGQLECVSCPARQYKRGTDRDDDAACEACPEGALCEPRLPAVALDGWWLYERAGPRSTGGGLLVSLPCEPGRCVDARSKSECAAVIKEDASTGHVACCGPFREPAPLNPMCGRCVSGYSEWGGQCVACTETDAPLLFAYLLLGFVLLFALEGATRRSSGATLKILVAFMQVMYTFFEADRSSPMLGAAVLSFSPLDLSGSCVFPASDMTKAVLPLVQICFFCLLLLVLLLANVAHWCFYQRRRVPPGAAATKFKRSAFMRVLMATLTFAYTPALRVALPISRCDNVNGTSVLRRFPTVKCSGAAHTAWLVASWAVAVGLLFGIGLFVALIGQRQYRRYARRHEQALSEAELKGLRKSIEERYGFLLLSYRPRREADSTKHEFCSWRGLEALGASWECVVLVRSTAFVVAASLVDDRQSKFALLVVISFLSLLAHVAVRPYRKPQENAMETGSFVVMTVVGAINATEWGEHGSVQAISSVLFYGFVVAVLAVAAATAWRSGSIRSRLSSVRTRFSSSRSSLGTSSASTSAVAAAASRMTLLVCWYRVRRRFEEDTGKPRITEDHSGVELAGEVGAPGDAGDKRQKDAVLAACVSDGHGNVWRRVPCWTCDATGETSWDAPDPAC